MANHHAHAMTTPRQQLQHSPSSWPTRPAATDIESDGLTEVVALARGQRGPDAESCREETRTVPPKPPVPPARKGARTLPPRLFASISRSAMAPAGPDAVRCREEARTAPPTPSAPPARKSARTPPPRLFGSISRSALASPSCWTAEPREQPSAHERQNLTIIATIRDSVLSAAATECDDGSPTTPTCSPCSLELGALGAGRYDQDPIVSRAHSDPGGHDARRGEGSTPPGTPITPAHMPREEVAGGSTTCKVCSVVRHEDILAEFHVHQRLREVRRPRRQKLQSSMD